MDVMAWPFRLGVNGAVATVVDGSAEADEQAVAVLALTRRGERELVPGFGTRDPVFSTLDVAELNAALSIFGPPVHVRAVEVTYPRVDTERITLHVERV